MLDAPAQRVCVLEWHAGIGLNVQCDAIGQPGLSYMELSIASTPGTASAVARIGATISGPGMRSMRSYVAARAIETPLKAITPDAASAAQSSADSQRPPHMRLPTSASEMPTNAAAEVSASLR